MIEYNLGREGGGGGVGWLHPIVHYTVWGDSTQKKYDFRL